MFQERSSKGRALAIALVFSLVFVGFVIALNWIANVVFAESVASGMRPRVTVELTAAMIAEVAAFGLVWRWLRRRGVSLRSLGLWRPAPAWGWAAAVLVAALFIWFNLALPLRNESNLAELSLFRVYNGLIAAFVAGFLEETMFRGFVMTELRRAGWGSSIQVVVSSLIYGAVHATWGLVAGVVTFELIGGAVIGTTVFGLFCGGVYLLSRRSLMPVICCHGAIDLVIEPWLFMVAVGMAQS